MMSQEEFLPWSEPDSDFFADNLLGIEDWGDSITDIKLGEDDVLLRNNDQEMDVNPDELSELLQNIGDDMWALSEDTIKELGAQIKQEPPSPSSSVSSLVSLDSSLPSSPESQLLKNGQSSPPHQPNTALDSKLLLPPIKTESNIASPPACIRSAANLVLPLSEKNVTTNVIKTEVSVTPSCIIKNEPITIQPCSLLKPLPNVPVGHVQKITIQNGQQPKLLQQGKGGVASTTANIAYIPVSGPIPTNAILVGSKQGIPIPKPISSVVGNGVPPVKSTQNTVINEKVMKRQQRMIKNRESACLSRKKKKEYLQSLEFKVKEVTQLNDKLNEENMKLKHRVTELEKENLMLKSNHTNWSSTAKKSTCVLAVVFLVALNLGPLSSLKDSLKFSSPDNLLSVHHGRALLQYQEDSKNIEQTKPLVYGPSRRQYTMSNDNSLNTKPNDPISKTNEERKDLIVVKKKWDFLSDMERKNVLSKKERRLKNKMKRMTRQNKAKMIEKPVCSPSQVNTTESTRLNEALGDWIHKYQVEKISRKKKQPLQRNKFKSAMKQLALRLTPNCTETEARKRKVQRHMFTRQHNAQSSTDSNQNAVQLFQGPDWLKVFSEAINRQDDTLYIVSFRQDHLVFQATKINTTQRPKMSLMMMAPTNGTTLNVTKDQESISMIQIDCQVMDTKHINIKKSSLPMSFADSVYHYRPSSQPAEHSPSIPTHSVS